MRLNASLRLRPYGVKPSMTVNALKSMWLLPWMGRRLSPFSAKAAETQPTTASLSMILLEQRWVSSCLTLALACERRHAGPKSEQMLFSTLKWSLSTGTELKVRVWCPTCYCTGDAQHSPEFWRIRQLIKDTAVGPRSSKRWRKKARADDSQ